MAQQQSREEENEVLRRWCEQLVGALDAQGLAVDLDAVLGLAGRAAHAVTRPAAPVTTFVAGYAAGLAAGSGRSTPEAAVQRAIETATQQCRQAAASRSDA